ncbi:hypothetical protein AB0G00_12850 [Nocardia salmonicida]|uniref:hypothetical protein n=1 Tax=Nocardia salmonicida TaxID=53431 RepID=UPI0033C452E4
MTSKPEQDIRDTPEFKTLQHDEQFRSWLLMQEAAQEIEFTVSQVPELDGLTGTREGLQVAEQELLRRFGDSSYSSEQNISLASRFLYFIGEVFRSNLEGQWVAVPSQPPKPPTSMVAVEFSSSFYNPRHMMGFVKQRRTGTELTKIYDRAVARYNWWVESGRPDRSAAWEGYL